MITRFYEELKKSPSFEFLNVDMSGEINPYTGLPVEIKKRDEDKGWTDVDDYAIGLGVMGYSIARKTPVVRTVEQVINTFKPAQNQLGFSFDRNSDRDIYQNYIKPLAVRPDSYRNENPFGGLVFFSEEDQEQLELYKLRGRSVSPLDDNYNYNMMTLQLGEGFQPIDLALTIAQVGFLASITRLGIRGLVGSIRNAPARINQGRKLIQRNIPDRFLSADEVANKIIAKAYITERKKTEQLNFLVNQLTKVQTQSEKIINKPKDWVFMKTLGKGKTPVEFHQDIIQNVINATKSNSLGAVKQRLNKLVRDNKATPKQREVLDKLDQELPLTKAETNVVNPVHTKWLNGEDLRYFNSRDPIFRSSLDDSNTFLKLDEQHKIRTNLDYLEKRYGNADFWNKLSQEQKEQFALDYEANDTSGNSAEKMLWVTLEPVSPTTGIHYTGVYTESFFTYFSGHEYCITGQGTSTTGIKPIWQCSGTMPGSGRYSKLPEVKFLDYSKVTGFTFNTDNLFTQDTPEKMYKSAGLDYEGIVQKIETTLNSNIVIAINKDFS